MRYPIELVQKFKAQEIRDIQRCAQLIKDQEKEVIEEVQKECPHKIGVLISGTVWSGSGYPSPALYRCVRCGDESVRLRFKEIISDTDYDRIASLPPITDSWWTEKPVPPPKPEPGPLEQHTPTPTLCERIRSLFRGE